MSVIIESKLGIFLCSWLSKLSDNIFIYLGVFFCHGILWIAEYLLSGNKQTSNLLLKAMFTSNKKMFEHHMFLWIA